MPSSARPALFLACALAGCGGHGGYRDAPHIAAPMGMGMVANGPMQAQPLVPERMPPDGGAYDAQPANLLPPPTQDLPPDAPQGTGPRGTSGEAREDAVGYASLLSAPPVPQLANVVIGVGHPTLAPGAFVELTALDTGRTIVAMVVAPGSDGGVVALSPAAARALGVESHAAVRVRTITPSPQDLVALRDGQVPVARLDAPPVLLIALRRKLTGQRDPGRAAAPPRASGVRATAPVRTKPVAPPAVARGRGGFVVQVAALSSTERAAALAEQVGGRVVAGGALYRVQLGPYATMAEAERARDGLARRGFGGARISHTE